MKDRALFYWQKKNLVWDLSFSSSNFTWLVRLLGKMLGRNLFMVYSYSYMHSKQRFFFFFCPQLDMHIFNRGLLMFIGQYLPLHFCPSVWNNFELVLEV